ncbi:MAG: thiolase family protein [Naasia sp.]
MASHKTAGNEVVFVDGVRTPFGRAGEKGVYWNTRADDLIVKAMIALLERNPSLPKDRVDDVAIAATTQEGDQGLTLGRTAALLAGLPRSVPGYAIDRMCAGAMTSVTTTAGGIAFGAYDVAIAGGVEHMGRHPMGFNADPNPRFLAERLVSEDALNMGSTAERIHDRFPQLTKERSDRFAMLSQHKLAAAYAAGLIQPDLVPIAAGSAEGWGLVTEDQGMRPETTMEGLATLKTPFRPHGRVSAGNSSPLTDGATVSLMASASAAKELGLTPKMHLVSFAFAGVEPEIMGIGPVPSTEKALAKAGLTIDDIGLFELNEAFAVQVLSLLDHFGVDDEDPRVNRWGGAISIGHPLAASGVRLMIQLAAQFQQHPEVRYGLTAMCVGLGQGGSVIWENPNWNGKKWDSGTLGDEAKQLSKRRKAEGKDAK